MVQMMTVVMVVIVCMMTGPLRSQIQISNGRKSIEDRNELVSEIYLQVPTLYKMGDRKRLHQQTHVVKYRK